MVLYGTEANIQEAVRRCITQAKGKHVLNLGHGVEQDTPEEAVACFVEAARLVKI
jgi:uroporphyrinogen-III decarboxylase